MKSVGTEIRLFTNTPSKSTIKIKFLEDEKMDIEKVKVFIANDQLFNLDTLNLTWEIDTYFNKLVSKKPLKASHIYQYLQEKISSFFVSNFQITHLKIHPFLQVKNAGAGFVEFDDGVKREFWLEPKRKFEEFIKTQNKKGE